MPGGPIIVCSTGLTAALKAEVKAAVEQNEWAFTGDLTTSVTHLVASEPGSPKYIVSSTLTFPTGVPLACVYSHLSCCGAGGRGVGPRDSDC
jgi:hypothetical protein